jgi:hypothetical protein
MFCNKCGQKLPDNSVFCYHCGNKLPKSEKKEVNEPIVPTPQQTKADEEPKHESTVIPISSIYKNNNTPNQTAYVNNNTTEYATNRDNNYNQPPSQGVNYNNNQPINTYPNTNNTTVAQSSKRNIKVLIFSIIAGIIVLIIIINGISSCGNSNISGNTNRSYNMNETAYGNTWDVCVNNAYYDDSMMSFIKVECTITNVSGSSAIFNTYLDFMLNINGVNLSGYSNYNASNIDAGSTFNTTIEFLISDDIDLDNSTIYFTCDGNKILLT